MSIPTFEPRRHARLLPRPRACVAASSSGVARRWPTCARVAVAHAPTLPVRPVCWPPPNTAVQGDTLRFVSVSRASNRRPPASAGV